MRVSLLSLVLSVLATSVTDVQASCEDADWSSSFNNKGLSMCDNSRKFMTGLYRDDRGNTDRLKRLDGARCCSRPTPWRQSSNMVIHSNWWSLLDNNNRWATCPDGYFLNGLYRDKDHDGWLHNIEEGRCVKPADAPYSYKNCVDKSVASCFNNKGWCNCNSGSFLTGIYRGDCDELHCLNKFRCCEPADEREVLDELFKVKNRIMDNTLRDMAHLGHYLGFGWCGGCRSEWVGDDFYKDGDTWKADQTRRCSGTKSGNRLRLAFGDWSFGTKEIVYGNAVVEDLEAESVDEGTIYNNDATEATKTISRTERSIRSVTHTTTSSWTKSHELGIEVSYTPPANTGGAGASVSYTFGYETSSTTTDSTQNQQWKDFTISSSKTLDPYSSVSFQLVMAKTRSTLPYTAKVLVRFSTEFTGFMRYGGGYNKQNTNYHEDNRGKKKRRTISYKFGSADLPFYTDLYQQSSTAQRPWMWHDMTNNHASAQGVINKLTNENKYTITLTGKFEDVIGKNVEFTWGTVSKKRSVSERDSDGSGHKVITTVTKAGPNDPPPPNPPPPKVDEPKDDDTDSDRKMEKAGGD